MFHFQTLDAYKRAIEFLPLAYSFARVLDGEMAGQLRRAETRIGGGQELLVRIVSILTKRINKPPTPTPTPTPTTRG